jgi:hypothetical protein
MIYGIKTQHQTHGLLDRVCDLKICSGFRARATSNVFVSTPLRLTGSRRRPALSLIAQLIGKLISPFIQDSIRASFVEGTLIARLEKLNRAVTFFKALTRFWLWTPYATEA